MAVYIRSANDVTYSKTLCWDMSYSLWGSEQGEMMLSPGQFFVESGTHTSSKRVCREVVVLMASGLKDFQVKARNYGHNFSQIWTQCGSHAIDIRITKIKYLKCRFLVPSSEWLHENLWNYGPGICPCFSSSLMDFMHMKVWKALNQWLML